MRIVTATLRRLPLLLLAGAVAACGSDNQDHAPGDLHIAISEGNGQADTIQATLEPFAVAVTDAAGAPVEGVEVSWVSQTQGNAGLQIDPVNSTTDAAGVATMVATLGTRTGEVLVDASVPGASVTFSSTILPGAAHAVVMVSGDAQRGPTGALLPQALATRVLDRAANPAPDATVAWRAFEGGGTPGTPTSVSDGNGLARVGWTMGPGVGVNRLWAVVGTSDSIGFVATATGPFTLKGGGNNMPERYGSDLWLADGFGYTGSWGLRGAQGNAVKIWQLDGQGVPVLKDSIVTPNLGTVSDLEVSPDGRWLVFTGENGTNHGIHVYELTAPGTAVLRAKNTSYNLHTGALSVIGGKLYAFTAKDPANCALVIYDLSDPASGTLPVASSTPIPDNYCIHDTFVRDGFAFVFAWNEGLYIFDVGNGIRGGTPQQPVQISRTAGFGGETHNGWWFWNPNGEKRYLFIGEEGPGSVGTSSSGSIHVVDVSTMTVPREVAFYTLAGAGAHNFWMDEQRQILYAAFYNGGVVALDVSGVLSGNLANREIARIQPGGAGNSYVWGVMLYNNSLYVSDMISGFWQLGTP